MEIPRELRIRDGGVASTRTLERLGVSRKQVSRMASRGEIERLRPGWYALPDPDPVVAAAVRAGGALSCVSALRRIGVWTPGHRGIHIRRSGHGQRVTAAHRHSCSIPGGPVSVRRAVDPLIVALQAVAGCVAHDELVAIVDSALHQGLMEYADVEEWFTDHRISIRRALDGCDARSESGTESLVRVRLRRLGLQVRSQVMIGGIGRVDLLVGNRLVVECDSKEHHTSRIAYETDRERDVEALAQDLLPMRLTYDAVQSRWARIEAAILAITGRGAHLRAATRRKPLPRSA